MDTSEKVLCLENRTGREKGSSEGARELVLTDFKGMSTGLDVLAPLGRDELVLMTLRY